MNRALSRRYSTSGDCISDAHRLSGVLAFRRSQFFGQLLAHKLTFS